MRHEAEEVHTELCRLSTGHFANQLVIGAIVRWKYEWTGDPQNGMLYMVVGFNNESPNIVVTRVLNNLGAIREFHASQLEMI
jgi:hypothetical protein